MSIDPRAAGATTDLHHHRYSWRDQVIYALGIGARRAELPYLYEQAAGGLKVYPTYAVVPAFPVVVELLRRAGADLAKVVHTGQRVWSHRPAPPEACLQTKGELVGVYDVKRYAKLVIKTASTLAGEALFDTEWTLIVSAAGRFGGPRPPAGGKTPKPPPGSAPDWTCEEPTSPEQALWYRLSGDINPLHADPQVARAAGFPDGPILHGLCTYGYLARALVRHAAAGDGDQLRSLSVQLSQPVWPGDTIITQGHDLGDGLWALRAAVKGRAGQVVTNAWAQLGPGSPAPGNND